jgi:hypothetical protein
MKRGMAEARLSEAEIEALSQKHYRSAPFGVSLLAHCASDEEVWPRDTARLLADREWLLKLGSEATQKYEVSRGDS